MINIGANFLLELCLPVMLCQFFRIGSSIRNCGRAETFLLLRGQQRRIHWIRDRVC